MMAENDYPYRMAGSAMGLVPRKLQGLTPQEVTARLRYQETFPQGTR